MKEYKENGLEFKYKECLGEQDFITLVKSYIEIYNNGLDGELDMIEGLHKNPILAERAFNMNLGNLCIENFDADLHTKIFNQGVYSFLKESIFNAKEAYNLAKEICRRVDSVDELVYQFLNKISNLIPSEVDLKKVEEAWTKVYSEYENIAIGNKEVEKQ